MATFAALLIDGIAYGMMLFLISAGLTVTLGVMRVVNLSHSAFAMIGGYLALWAMKGAGASFWLAVPLAVLGTMAIGLVLERTLYRWVYATHPLGQLLMTIGLAFILTALMKTLAGPSLQTLAIPDLLKGNATFGPLTVSIYRMALLAVSALAALGLWLALERTRFGARLRAAVDDPAMARCGVPLTDGSPPAPGGLIEIETKAGRYAHLAVASGSSAVLPTTYATRRASPSGPGAATTAACAIAGWRASACSSGASG